LVQVNRGTLQLPSATTNAVGTMQLNGGALQAGGTLAFMGGKLDGSGTVGAVTLMGGIISPGLGGPGALSFVSNLSLGSNATLVLDGTGTVPGTGYDQLSVVGPVALGNATLEVTALPDVATGTAFVIITNHSTAAVSGTFNGLPEQALLAVGNQLFRISYQGDSGNDVTLTRVANTNAQAEFNSVTRLVDGTIQLGATGAAGLTYTLQANSDLTTPNWITLGVVTADTRGNLAIAKASTAANRSFGNDARGSKRAARSGFSELIEIFT
jgi:hypothetical protein